MTRDPAVAYTAADGTGELRSPYWRSQFDNVQDAVTSFLLDYDDANQRASALDERILGQASSISPNYADLVSLAARQAMGGTELTIRGSGNQWNTSDVKMFMKDMGTSGRVSPVEGLYSSFPSFLYLNASYGGYLLEPILEYGNSSSWPNPYAPRDLGLNYPNATGNSATHSQGVEQSGNMLIMALAHAKASGDGSLLSRYYGLLKNWADYLVDNSSPLPEGQ
ncbi:hypothetical protein PHLCEN_2v111 [Hermanssonia centrifuga]|uniref:Glutaminase A n=1 Tax=Hermanssonia centrifuga TaxID=98765 RepID=A0A2R6S6X5_9APHY|nr:hypothetical protein PHLCEN_2v111 [Hermanssonia centrifuga]